MTKCEKSPWRWGLVSHCKNSYTFSAIYNRLRRYNKMLQFFLNPLIIPTPLSLSPSIAWLLPIQDEEMNFLSSYITGEWDVHDQFVSLWSTEKRWIIFLPHRQQNQLYFLGLLPVDGCRIIWINACWQEDKILETAAPLGEPVTSLQSSLSKILINYKNIHELIIKYLEGVTQTS